MNTRQHYDAILKLTNNLNSKHEGVKCSCNQCEYQATTQRFLKTHKQSKHEGVKYACNQCEYQATTQRFLKTHKQSKHEDVKYSCTQCEYQPIETFPHSLHITQSRLCFDNKLYF